MTDQFNQNEQLLSNSVLVEVFSHLDTVSLCRAAQVCQQWRDVAQYDQLWKQLAASNWNIKELPPWQASWKQELKRLEYHVPRIEIATIEKHEDEVLDVAVSHDGALLCTCCKDGKICLFDITTQTELHTVDLVKQLNWESIQGGVFNKSSSLLFICGVQSVLGYQCGVGAVFTVPDMRLAFDLDVDPYTMSGAWLTDRVVLVGRFEEMNVIKIQAVEVSDEDILYAKESGDWDGVSNRIGVTLLKYQGVRHHQMTLLIANVPASNETLTLSQKSTCDKPLTSLHGTNHNATLESHQACDESLGINGNDHKFDDHETVRVTRSSLKRKHHLLKPSSKTFLAVVTGVHDVIGVQEITQAQLDAAFVNTDGTHLVTMATLGNLFHVQDCYITGMCVSYEQSLLYFNYRVRDKSRSAEAELNHLDSSEMTYYEEIMVGAIDLVTMTIQTQTGFRGHRGFSSSPPWFICLACSKDFLASGGEDARAHIWDRHHQVSVAHLQHMEGVVNGIAFCPLDQEICYTVCDDHSVRIWYSKHKCDVMGLT